ncbi:hypothetical protein EJ03DRAFT_40529 [Teratosphaeria nubilosa]|uniref:Uncharacterized protein n=1 Tax=Teratosphaeria nubilosa TaxID=161662 RepID=A0A6G1KUY0_9PEZI|nr:hypothetical protein EJ03DRAFT_40529 [Teratosphaeria nubilosa]
MGWAPPPSTSAAEPACDLREVSRLLEGLERGTNAPPRSQHAKAWLAPLRIYFSAPGPPGYRMPRLCTLQRCCAPRCLATPCGGQPVCSGGIAPKQTSTITTASAFPPQASPSSTCTKVARRLQVTGKHAMSCVYSVLLNPLPTRRRLRVQCSSLCKPASTYCKRRIDDGPCGPNRIIRAAICTQSLASRELPFGSTFPERRLLR